MSRLRSRLAPFIAGYVLVLAVLSPVVAGRAHLLARALEAARSLLSGGRAGRPPDAGSHADPAPDPAPDPPEANASRPTAGI
ncbi:hypothetical protein OHB11_39425 [Streptomyces zaomyceticus]|uniref:Uncharacterized protein n=1 Tax=Streptomyces zaomyceticus TaxID=68286 RepID=A0ABZ1L3C1_9ACTN|nr:hypothetical protein OG237_00385 [Streptomyces zaomyceticus]WSQ23467.1 hypothetical protein OG237_41670 [Streptomyces zaomyceticus]